MTQADLSRASGLDSGTISNIRNGKRRMGVDVAERIAKATHMKTQDILRMAGEIDEQDTVDKIHVSGRRNAMYQGMKELCEAVGVEWKSPHKIRHGHGVYGVKRAKTRADYRALSQNMMHETTATTDRYTELIEDEVGDIISGFTPE